MTTLPPLTQRPMPSETPLAVAQVPDPSLGVRGPQLFQLLDDDSSGGLEVDELETSMKRLLAIASNSATAKAAEKAALAVSSKAKKKAEDLQQAAHDTLVAAEMRYAEALDAARAEIEAKEAAARAEKSKGAAARKALAAKVEKEHAMGLNKLRG
jgi:hypothetical protein